MMASNLLNSIKETTKHGLVYGFGSILSKAIGILLIPLYTRYLSPSDYGILSLLIITSTIAVALFQMGLTTAVFRSYYDYDDEENRSKVISTAFYILFASSLFLSILGYFLSSLLSQAIFESYKYIKYFHLIIFTASLDILSTLAYMVYRVRMQSKKYTIFNVSFFTLRLGLIIYFVAIAKQGIWGIIFSNFLISLISMIILMFTIRKDIKPIFSRLEARKLFSFGLPLVPQNLSEHILISADSYFLKIFSTTVAVGLYNLGYKFGIAIQALLVLPLTMAWSPMMLSIKDRDFSDRYYSKVLTYFMFVGIFLVLSISLLSKEVIQALADKSFWEAYKVVPLIAFSYLLLGVQRIISVGIILRRKTQYSAMVFVVAAMLNMILNYFLIPRYGMMGAAYATVISYFSVNLMKYPIVMRLYRINYEWGRIFKIIMSGLLLYFIGTMIETGNICINLVLKAFIVSLFPFLLIILKFYEEQENRKIMELYKQYLTLG